ncbi:Hypothetical protein MSYG_0392 [Malassezia sympodialis ATCC 42132]|uniref:Uncharacterized protein n=1 Tax=Malassezia sympodialis (strain ATCC 42132) TaxID=1230383 RepID=A0A1M8A147_MALS4|nr:Hypothetical protein MSYG_0392 [Malassezia sympodialis ATCC 42132]
MGAEANSEHALLQAVDIPCDANLTWSDGSAGVEQVVRDLFQSRTRIVNPDVQRVGSGHFPLREIHAMQGEQDRIAAIQRQSDRMYATGLIHEQALATFIEEAFSLLKGRPFSSLSEHEKIMVREKLAMGVALSGVQCAPGDAIYRFVPVRSVQQPEDTKVQDFMIDAVVQALCLTVHMCLILCTALMPLLGVPGPVPSIPWLPSMKMTTSLVSMAWKGQYVCTKAIISTVLRGHSLCAKPVQRQTPLRDRLVYASQCLAISIRQSSLPSQVALLVQLGRRTTQHLDTKLGWSRMWSSIPLCLLTNTLCYMSERKFHLIFTRTIYALLESFLAAVDAYRHEVPS